MRKPPGNKNQPMYGIFVARGKDSSRLEQLSDCIFALAITMSLFSTVPPKNFRDLMLFISDLVPFGISILAVIWIWYSHYQFFMRFGLRDMPIIILNTILMVVVLFFVYPLKFLSTWLVKYLTLLFKALVIDSSYFAELGNLAREMIPWQNMPELLITYDIGFLAIFGCFVLMYRHALKKGGELQLSALEEHEARSIKAHYSGVASVASLSLLIALFGYVANWQFAGLYAGLIYFLIGPISFFTARKYQKRWQRIALKTYDAKDR